MNHHDIDVSSGRCRVWVGESLRNLAVRLPRGKTVVVTDRTVASLYGALFGPFERIEIGCGENQKNLSTVEMIYSRFLDFSVDRSTFIIGIGGGIVCDLTGFAASTFLRGLDFGFAPTTLLAQVDAALGGKNGVNYRGYKNYVGTFRQPRFVLCDPEVLITLPEKQRLCGLAEIIKHTLIRSRAGFENLERDWPALLALDRDITERVIDESVRIKLGIVRADDRERGERRLLNFGHTLGHALEREDRISHGEAVSLGMLAASRISSALGLLPDGEARRIEALLTAVGLPTALRPEKERLLDAVRRDKKREGADIHFVVLREIGQAEIRTIPYSDLESLIDDLC